MDVESKVDTLLQKLKPKRKRLSKDTYIFLGVLIVASCLGTLMIIPASREWMQETFFSAREEPLSPLGAWWDSNYLNYRIITVESDYIDVGLGNFPLLVVLDNSSGDYHFHNNGADIEFVSLDNTTQFNHEIEKFDNSGNTFCWVNISETIPSGSDYNFLVYYNYSSDTKIHYNPLSVWDINYTMVLHMNDYTTSQVNGSTSNSHNGTKAGANQPIENSSGQIGNAQTFDGTNDYIDLLTLPVAINNDEIGTIECWSYNPGQTASHRIFCASDYSDTTSYLEFYAYATNMKYRSYEGVTEMLQFTLGDPYEDNWYYHAWSMGTGGTLFRLNTIDPSTFNTGTASSQCWFNTTQDIDVSCIGCMHRVANPHGDKWVGTIDEFRISNINRNASWLNASFYNQNQTTGFMSFSGQQPPANTAPVISSPTPSNNSVNQSITQTTSVSCSIADTDGDTMSWNIDVSNGDTNSGSDTDTTISCSLTTPLSYNTTYTWWVNVSDGEGGTANTTYNFTTKKDQIRIWFTSDTHIGMSSSVYVNFSDAVNDTNDIECEYAFSIGDMVHNDNSYWSSFHTLWDNLNTTYQNYTVGNHDVDWDDSGRLGSLNYTYQIGNLLIIVIGDEDTPTINSASSGNGTYTSQLSWLNTTVQANTDKNIIVLSHHPVKDTTYLHATDAASMGIEAYVKDDTDYANFISWVENDSDAHIDAWLHGHTHYGQNETHDSMISDERGTLFANIGTLTSHWGQDAPHPVESTYWYFTNDSTEVKIEAYDHANNKNVISSNEPYPYTFNLTYAFTFNNAPTQSGEVPVNSSTGISLTPTLNVTVDDADDDWLNVTWLSNSSGAWVQFASNNSLVGGSLPTNIIQDNSNFSAYNTKYYWSVNLSDGTDWTNNTYHFTTEAAPSWTQNTIFWFEGGNYSSWQQNETFWFTGGNVSSTSQVDLFWFTGGNISNWQRNTLFWFVGGNISTTNQVTDFWFTGGNVSAVKTWEQNTTFWFTGGNVSMTNQETVFWFVGGNISSTNQVDVFWFEGGNISNWQQQTLFWFLGGNVSAVRTWGRNTLFWFIGGNISDWNQETDFWFSGGNVSSTNQVDLFWFTGGNVSNWEQNTTFWFVGGSARIWNQNTTFWFEGGNVSAARAWEQNTTFWFEGGNYSSWQQNDTFWFSGGNVSSTNQVTDFWFLGGNVSTTTQVTDFWFTGGNISSTNQVTTFWFSGGNETTLPSWSQNTVFWFTGGNITDWNQETVFWFLGGNETLVITITNEYPENNSDTLITQPLLYFNLTSPTSNLMNYSIYVGNSPDNCNIWLCTFSNVGNGTHRNSSQYYSAINFTTYCWRIQAEDGINMINETFNFTILRQGGGGVTSRLGTAVAMGVLAGLAGSIIFGLLFVKKKKERWR